MKWKYRLLCFILIHRKAVKNRLNQGGNMPGSGNYIVKINKKRVINNVF